MRPDLIEAARSGDGRHSMSSQPGSSTACYSVARLILRDTDRAEDATQETLVRCWRDLPTLRP